MTAAASHQAFVLRTEPVPVSSVPASILAAGRIDAINQFAAAAHAECVAHWQAIKSTYADWGLWLIDMSHALERIEKARKKEIFNDF